MNISRLALVTAFGLGLSSTGCLGNTDPVAQPADEDIEAPHFKTLVDPGGGIGPNGLMPSYFHDHKGQLLQALQHPLLLNSDFSPQLLATEILETPEGVRALYYAVGCALPDGFQLTKNLVTYKGQGLLSTTPGWANPDGVMLAGAEKDLFSCMAAHLNPSGQTVSILLIGQSVPDDLSDQSAYTFNEALWAAKGSGTTGITIDVWPQGDLKRWCPRDIEPVLQSRFCGLGVSNCGINIRNDDDVVCSVSGGFYTCAGERAIKTKLMPADVSKLYGGCGI